MCIPILAMGVMSFWQQTGHMSFDMSGTLQNYVEALTRDMYRVLFLRSLGISGLTTLATVVMAFPLAYFIAFYVKRTAAGDCYQLAQPYSRDLSRQSCKPPL